MKKTTVLVIAVVSAFLFLLPAPESIGEYICGKRKQSPETSPYGDYCPQRQGRYGATRVVESKEAAQAILEEYYRNRHVTIKSLEQRRGFFRAEIIDSSGNLVDTVIIDRRTGRIRSTF